MSVPCTCPFPKPPRYAGPAQGRQAPLAARASTSAWPSCWCWRPCSARRAISTSRAWTVQPWSLAGLLGVLAAPLLHGSLEHLAANAIALLMLGTLAGACTRARRCGRCRCCGSAPGLGAWLLGDAGSHHLGASGLTHGLMFLVFILGLLRRDRACGRGGDDRILVLRRHAADGAAARSRRVVAGAPGRRGRRRARGLAVPAQPIRCRRASATAGKTRKNRSRRSTTSWSRLRRAKCRCCGTGPSTRTTADTAWCCDSRRDRTASESMRPTPRRMPSANAPEPTATPCARARPRFCPPRPKPRQYRGFRPRPTCHRDSRDGNTVTPRAVGRHAVPAISSTPSESTPRCPTPPRSSTP